MNIFHTIITSSVTPDQFSPTIRWQAESTFIWEVYRRQGGVGPIAMLMTPLQTVACIAPKIQTEKPRLPKTKLKPVNVIQWGEQQSLLNTPPSSGGGLILSLVPVWRLFGATRWICINSPYRCLKCYCSWWQLAVCGIVILVTNAWLQFWG